MGKKSSTYTEIDPRVGESMNRQAELAQEFQDWQQREYLPTMMAQTVRQNERQYALAQFARDLAYQQRDQTRERTDKYNAYADAAWDRFAGITKLTDPYFSSEALNYNEAAERDRKIEEAIGDLTMGYALNRKNVVHQYNGLGIDPTSGRFQGGLRSLSDDEANNKAQAKLAAERAAKELGWNKQMTAVGIGQGYLQGAIDYANSANNTISTGMGQVLSSLGSASNAAQTQLSNTGNVYSSYGSNLTSLMNQNQSAFNLGMGASNSSLNQSIANNQNNALAAAGYGQAIGSVAGATASGVNRLIYG